MHEHERRKKRWTSVRGDKFVSNERPVSGINTRWGILAPLGSSIARFLMNNGCRLASCLCMFICEHCALHVLLLQRSTLGLVIRRGAALCNLRTVVGGNFALFVLRKCHNWKTIEWVAWVCQCQSKVQCWGQENEDEPTPVSWLTRPWGNFPNESRGQVQLIRDDFLRKLDLGAEPLPCASWRNSCKDAIRAIDTVMVISGVSWHYHHKRPRNKVMSWVCVTCHAAPPGQERACDDNCDNNAIVM